MITLLCGLPASGKTTTTKQEGDMVCTEAITICPDDVRKILSGKDHFPPVEEFVWGSVKTCARILLSQDRHIIIDATHLTKGSRMQWIRIADEFDCHIRIFWHDTPLDECKRRNAARERQVPEDVMDRMAEGFEPPTLDEGFQNVYRVLPDGSEERMVS
jgi:predicted kinase